MKKSIWLLPLVLLFGLQLLAQEHYTEGPVWRLTTVRVKPNQMDAYLTSLRQSSKPFLDEEKRQGMILDYKILIKETKNDPGDWDLALVVIYKNHAAMDNLVARAEAIRDKVLGGKQQAHQLGEKREEIRETISSDLLQEIMLK
jgi:hypothetical protein